MTDHFVNLGTLDVARAVALARAVPWLIAGLLLFAALWPKK